MMRPFALVAALTLFVFATAPAALAEGERELGSDAVLLTGNDLAVALTGVTASAITWAQTAAGDTDTTGNVLFVPPDIRQACVRLTGWLYRQKDTQSGDIDRPILAGDGSVIMPTTLPQDVQAILSQWIRIIV